MNQIPNGWLTYISPSTWYTLTYPQTWKCDVEGDCTTFYRINHGIGALQISAYKTNELPSATGNLVEYLDDEQITAEIETDLMPNEQEIASCSYETSDTLTKVWFITKDAYLIFLTYNCEPSLQNQEVADVEAIVRSLRIID